MDNKELTITLTIAEANGVLQALGQMPFVQVVGLIKKIQEQSAPQVKPEVENG